MHNDGARFLDRWVDLEIPANNSPWLNGISSLSLPIAHGEGKYYVDAQTLNQINSDLELNRATSSGRSIVKYTLGEISSREKLASNPNGSINDIAGLTSADGRILGLMPHPERAIFFHHLPHWTYLREEYKREGRSCPEYGPGLVIFKNAVKYFLGAEELSLR